MYKEIKKCVWDNYGPYYNTGKGIVFIFDGAEEGNFWIWDDNQDDYLHKVPLDYALEFVQFVSFCLQHIKEWQNSDEGRDCLNRIKIEKKGKIVR